MFRSAWARVLSIATLTVVAHSAMVAQTATYRLHRTNSSTSGLLQLNASNPTTPTLAIPNPVNLKNAALGEYIIKAFDTQAGVPNASGTIPSGSTVSFTLWMRKTSIASGSGTMFPRAKVFKNNASGTQLCTWTGGTALNATVTKVTGPTVATCTTSAPISMTTADRFYLWVGVNLTVKPTININAELDIEGTLNGNFDSSVVIPLPVPPPVVFGFNPSSGNFGSSVIISGTTFGTSQGTVQFDGGGTPVNATVTPPWSDTQVTATVPTGAHYGPITITAANGSSGSSSSSFLPPPVVSSVSPTSARPGTVVTITGYNFFLGQTLTFNGLAATNFTVNSATSITATVPTGASTGPIVITNLGLVSNNNVIFGVPPQIDTLSKTFGPVGAPVTLSGSNFGATQSTVKFGTAVASIANWSDTSITVAVPSGATSGNVTVTVGTLVSNGLPYSVVATPSISSISPTSGTFGTVVTISGSGFGATQDTTAVTFNGTPALPTTWSDTSIVTPVPPDATSGPVAVVLQTVSSNTNKTFSVSSAISYSYDVLGRLVGMVDQSGNTATYSYDSVGNLLSIGRSGPGVAPSIVNFTPSSGPIGTVVTVNGTNFVSPASQNTVKFNGLAGTVTFARPTQLTVTVPSGAATGPVSVTTLNGTATSTASFTVTASPAPTITSFTPPTGSLPTPTTPGTTVTISGTNFDTTAANDKVSFNATNAEIVSATAASITTTVPANTSSGQISVGTPFGKAVSTSEFIIPPLNYVAADIGFTGRTSLGSSISGSLAANKVALVLFDAVPGQRVYFRKGTGTLSYSMQLVDPRGIDLGVFADDAKNLTVNGTYTLVLSGGFSSGSFTVTLLTVPADVAPTIAIAGPAVTVTTTSVGQDARVTFPGLQGQKVFLQASNNSMGGAQMTLQNPHGYTVAGAFGNTGAYIDTATLPLDGTYTIFINPSAETIGSVTLTLYDAADATANITAGGATVTTTTTTPGKDVRLTIVAPQGQRVSETWDNTTVWNNAKLVGPDGNIYAFPTDVGYIDTQPLTLPGSYSLVLTHSGNLTGTVISRVYAVPSDISGTITPGGAGVVTTTNTPGQKASLTFTGAAQQKVSVKVSNVSAGIAGGYVTLKDPNNAPLGQSYFDFATVGFIDTTTLGTPGPHKVFLDPGKYTGSTTTTVYNVPANAIGGALTMNGVSKSITISTPGQNGSFTFNGTLNQLVTVHITNNVIGALDVQLKEPTNGSVIAETISSGNFNLVQTSLPAAGTYTIFIDPQGAGTGSMSASVTSP